MGFPRQENWSGLPLPSPGGIFLTQGLTLLHWQAESLPMDHQESPPKKLLCCKLKEGELYGILCEFYLSKAAIKKKQNKTALY